MVQGNWMGTQGVTSPDEGRRSPFRDNQEGCSIEGMACKRVGWYWCLRLLQQADDLPVGGLSEITIVKTDGAEVLRRRKADDVVRVRR